MYCCQGIVLKTWHWVMREKVKFENFKIFFWKIRWIKERKRIRLVTMLTFIILWNEFSSRQILMIFFFRIFQENGIWNFMQILRPQETICMKCHIIFPWKNKKHISDVVCWIFYPASRALNRNWKKKYAIGLPKDGTPTDKIKTNYQTVS